MKTAEETQQIFYNETGLKYNISCEKYTNWLEKQVRELYGQTIRYKEYTSQFKPKQEDKAEEVYIRDEVEELIRKGIYDITGQARGVIGINKWIEENLKSPSPKKELSSISDEDVMEVQKLHPVIGGGDALKYWIYVKVREGKLNCKAYQYLQSKNYKLPKYY